MLQNKKRNNCMSHGLWERKPLVFKGWRIPLKLQVNTMQNILSSFSLTKIFILHHLLSSQTNIRKVFLSLTFYTAIKFSHWIFTEYFCKFPLNNREYFKMSVLFLYFEWKQSSEFNMDWKNGSYQLRTAFSRNLKSKRRPPYFNHLWGPNYSVRYTILMGQYLLKPCLQVS